MEKNWIIVVWLDNPYWGLIKLNLDCGLDYKMANVRLERSKRY